MNLSLYIAGRYLVSKKSHHAINIISGISVVGVAVATAALVCILSVFNGFQDMIANLFTAFDPELKVVPAVGKFMDADSPALADLRQNPKVATYSEVLQDNALVTVNGRQAMATIKGVDDNFSQLIDFDRIRYGDGAYELHVDVIDYGIFGVNLLSNLGLGSDFPTPIQVYAPRGDERIDMTDPTESFNQDELYSPHVAFCVKQSKYDSNYVITSLRFARNLFERDNQLSAIELKLKPGTSTDKAKSEIAAQMGADYKVLDRYEQQEDTFKIMKIEKLISYIFLTFILMIACFNIIGSLSMLIIDKKNDVATLRNLGATEHQISSIFMAEGRMIALTGAVIGIILGLLLCYIQQEFGVIKFGQSAGSYIIDSYPVSVKWTDILIVFITVVVVGFLSVWYPVRQLTRRLTRHAAIALLPLILLTSCRADSDKLTIKGSFDDMPAGQLYIYCFTDAASTFDTLYITNGKFTYEAQQDQLTPYILVFPNAIEQVIFAKNGQEITYKASTKDLKNYTADGNSENKLMNRFRQETKDLNGVQVQEVARQYINQHAESPVAVYLFNRYFLQENNSYAADEMGALIDLLIKAQPESPLLHEAADRYAAIQQAQVGKAMPDIKLPTRSHININLGQLTAHQTVLIYWASWMPRVYDFIDNLNVTIDEYTEGRDLEFIAISLDTEQYKWVNRIKEDTIRCEHACELRAWDSPSVSALGITEVPSYVIVDNRHTIVARGNSLDDLENDLMTIK